MPDFLKVLTADIARVDYDGAVVLALIRFVTNLDDETHGRVRIDGQIWWRASYAEIGELLGVDRYSIRRTLAKLEAGGSLLCRESRATDRTKAYRVADQSLCENATGVSSHYADSQQPEPESGGAVANSQQGCGGNATAGVADSQLALLNKEGGKEVKEGGARAGAREVTRADDHEPPPRVCLSHQPNGTDEPCGRCKDARIAWEQWQEEHPTRRLSAVDQKALGWRAMKDRDPPAIPIESERVWPIDE
jgi:hypothetical protein